MLFGDSDETVKHMVSECTKLTQKALSKNFKNLKKR